MNKKLVAMTVVLFGLGVVLASCAGMMTKPTESNFKAPTVALDSIQLSFYEGFWYYAKADVAKGKAPAGGGSSPITMDFVFNVTNFNAYSVKLDSCRFTLYFDDYELRVVNDLNPMWIPPGKTNSKVMSVTLTPFSTYVKFLLANKQLAAERGDEPWAMIEKWWTEMPEMSFPIDLKEGAFAFSADSLVKVVPVDVRYP